MLGRSEDAIFERDKNGADEKETKKRFRKKNLNKENVFLDAFFFQYQEKSFTFTMQKTVGLQPSLFFRNNRFCRVSWFSAVALNYGTGILKTTAVTFLIFPWDIFGPITCGFLETKEEWLSDLLIPGVWWASKYFCYKLEKKILIRFFFRNPSIFILPPGIKIKVKASSFT